MLEKWKRLLARLDTYGFSLEFTTFIQSYLNKRMQKINFNNKFLALKDICSWVPQVSILSQLLFNILINDMFIFLTTFNTFNYGDDNTLYPYSKDFHQVEEYMEKDCEILENSFFDN